MRILVVEDDQLLNKTLSYNLSAVGYSVDGAMSKAVAIRFLEKQDYDLIVLDVNLPDGNGFDICHEVKERRPDTAVIFLTANDMESDIYDTLAMALGGIFLNAERKHIQVEVNCPETLVVSHDRKWTAEALFNILDNAVKYTPEYGSIRVCVESWEMHLKVSITDTGKGIPENQQGAIFRRFYREEDVHDIEGIGIGLYLAREIISLQNGYIQVTSQVGTGSTFSVFLPHE